MGRKLQFAAALREVQHETGRRVLFTVREEMQHEAETKRGNEA